MTALLFAHKKNEGYAGIWPFILTDFRTYLCFGLTAHIQLLQPECEMTSYTLPGEPRHAVASWLKHAVKLAKLLPDGHSRLVNLNTAAQVAHSYSPRITSAGT